VNSRAELEARYLEADFSTYFRFLDACRGTERGRDTQEHHVCPRKQFPEFIATRTVFFELQRTGAVRGGNTTGKKHKENKTGIFGLTLEQRSVIQRKASHSVTRAQHQASGRNSGLLHKEKGTGVFAAGVRARGGKRGGLKGGPAGMHVRWHLQRNIVSLSCQLCKKLVH